MRTLLLVAVLGVVGCAHLRESRTVCPEYRDIRCVAGAECSYDKARGCEVCRCRQLPTGLPMTPVDAAK